MLFRTLQPTGLRFGGPAQLDHNRDEAKIRVRGVKDVDAEPVLESEAP